MTSQSLNILRSSAYPVLYYYISPTSLFQFHTRATHLSQTRRGAHRERRAEEENMGSGILEVQLIDARGLKHTDFFGKIDPYVLVQYRNQERKSNVAKDQGVNPVWNQSFKFTAQYPGVDSQHKLVLKIMDHDTFSRDDCLGEATIPLSDMLAAGVEKGFSELRPCKYNVVLPDLTYSGEIKVSVTFTKNKDAGGNEEFGGWRHSSFN